MNCKWYGKTVLAVTLVYALCVPAMAQVLKGSISGTVTDPQGAVTSGAEVKATQVETGASYVTQSNSDGLFRLNLLPTGHYNVTISKQGFNAWTSQGVVVAAGVSSSLGSPRLSVGTADTVPVEAPATATALQGTEAQITDLTSDTVLGNFSGIEENEGLDRMALFIPGAVNTRTNNFSDVNGAPFSVNGLRGRNNDQQIDGQGNNDSFITGPYTFLSDPNFVQQYVVTSNNFAPEYGRNSGSVVNVITRSGTNAWHGSIYGTLTDTPFNAFSSFQKFDAVTKDTPRQNRNDEFTGFTVGGPMVKNKLFIFGGFDDEIINTSTVFTDNIFTPTPLGLTQLAGCTGLNANALSFLNQFGPYSFKEGNPTPVPSPFTGTFATFGLGPGCTGIQFGGVTRTLPTPIHIYHGVVRSDLQLGSDTITSRYLFNRQTTFNTIDNPAMGWAANQYSLSQQALVSWTHNFTAHMVNEARLSFGRLSVDIGGNTIGNPLEPGYKRLPDAFPSVTFGGGGTIGPALNLPQGRIQNTWQAQDNWNYVLGRHQLKAGVNYTYQKTPQVLPIAFNGLLRFPSVASFLVFNQPNQVEMSRGNPGTDYREHDLSLYFGDDWKITQNLVLNLGLTWSYFSQPVNLFHDVTTRREDAASTAFWDPSLPLSVRTVPTVSTPLNNFGPSVGFAYSPQWGGWLTGSGKTVVRGGYRLLYDPAFYNIYTNIATSAPNLFTRTLSGPAAAPFPLAANPTGDLVRAELAPIFSGTFDPRLQPETIVAPDFKPDRVHAWSLGVERELTRNSVFEARYVGNHGTHLFQSVNGNPFIADLKTDFPNLVPDNLTPCPAAQAFNPIAVGRVHCDEGAVRSRTNTGYSYYNGLQLEFRANNLFKQLTMRTGYTWSKNLDNTSEIFGTQSAGNTVPFSQNPVWERQAEYGIAGIDAPHVFTLLFTEQLPFFKEQHGPTGHLLGGWALSGNYIAASGQPYTPLQALEEGVRSASGNFYDSTFVNSFLGTDAARPFYGNRHAPADSVGIFASDLCKGVFGITPGPSPFFPGACNTAITNPNQLLSMNSLNSGGQGFLFGGPGTSSGQAPVTVTPDQVRFIVNGGVAQQVFGSPFGNVPRGALRDAPQNVVNLTLSKDTRITERVSLRLHLTALNAFNHFNFSNVDAILEDAGIHPTTTGLAFGAGFAHPEFNSASGRTIYFGAKLIF